MIVQTIKQDKGRFITKRKEDEYGGWVEVSDEVAREKVSHGFRTKSRKNGALLLKEAMGGEGTLLKYGKSQQTSEEPDEMSLDD